MAARCSRMIMVLIVMLIAALLCGCTGHMAITRGDAGGSLDRAAQRETHEQLNCVLWVQTSPEYEFACRQSYRLAESKLDAALLDRHWTAALEQAEGYEELPPAVIVDVDETVLDNSPFEARLVLKRTDFDQTMWDEWVKEERAPAIPGAQDFIGHALERGVEIFFVTNRANRDEEHTVRNLRHEFGPVATAQNVLTKGEQPGWTSDKSSRRAHVAATHRILLLVGDDFNDFAHLGNVSPQVRLETAGQYSEYWGTRWIILPNPMYGGWEQALYGHDRGLEDGEKLRLKHNALDAAE